MIQDQYCTMRTHFSQHKNGNTRNKTWPKIGGHRKHRGINTGKSNLVLAVELGNRAKAKSEAEGRHWHNEVGREIPPLTGTGRKLIWEETGWRQNCRSQLRI